jgi:predicted dehydrogenase
MPTEDRSRRDFLRHATATGAAMSAALGAAGSALGASKSSSRSSARVLGANDRINVGVIGVGGRGHYVGSEFAKIGKDKNLCQVIAVADTYQKRITKAKKDIGAQDGYLDYREIINRNDIDAVIVATPDHWHARIALELMDHGKDVYLEKPMCHTIEEAHHLVATVKETGRVLQVGSQTTSADQWWKAKKAIADGMIGKMLMSQGSYHRNSVDGEWNYTIDPAAGPDATGEDHIDWKMWLGSATKRAWDPDRFFRFRKYWDYSGGIATDLFYHVVAPLNICWSKPQFPSKVMASGGIYGGPNFEMKREVPDTFHLMAEYAEGHSLVLSSSMANSQHIPGLIRGHHGTIIMVDHGMFESTTEAITLKPEVRTIRNRETNERVRKAMFEDYKFGTEEQKIAVDNTVPVMEKHIVNFLDCMKTRQKPHLDVETGACAQVLITMAVESYRQGKVLYFDEKKWKVSEKPVRA